MPLKPYNFFLLASLLILLCTDNFNKEKKAIFTKLKNTDCGIGFYNIITENDLVNLISNEYTYMGGGVGIIDLSNVSLCNRLSIHHTVINIIHCP